jgi:aminopeptidase N
MALMAPSKGKVEHLTENPHRQYWTVQFQNTLERGNYSLAINFNGTLTDSLRGYYRARLHSDDEKSLKYIATTQFEPTDARRAFPCFDEPGLKATFGISMTVPPGFHALSNMPVRETLDAAEEGWKSFSFEKTVRMSTYLIAFIVSE